MAETGDSEHEDAVQGEMRPEYNFSNAERGKFYQDAIVHLNVVLLEPDVAKAFPDSGSVNRALRLLIEVARNEANARVLAEQKESYKAE